jgi:hypothetical protein
MAEPHVITALAKKRAELSGDIAITQKRLHQMIADLEKLDATLLMFDPSYDIPSIKPNTFRPPDDWSKRGQMTRLCLGILRKAAEPLTSREIATQLIIERALDQNDVKLANLMVKRVGVALRGQRNKGVVESEQGPGQSMIWRLA